MTWQTIALIVLCLGSALGWAALRTSPRLRLLAPPLLGVALGLAPQSAFLLAEGIGGRGLVDDPAYAASAIAYDQAAVWMRDRLAIVKELPGGLFALAIIALAAGALALNRPMIVSLPMRALRVISAAAFIASIATTFTLATGNPAWEPMSDAQLRADLRGAMHDAVALNLQKEMTADPAALAAEELDRFIAFLKAHIELLSDNPCAQRQPASERNAGAGDGVPCRPVDREGNLKEKRDRVLAIALRQAVEDVVRSAASEMPDANPEPAGDSYAARDALGRQRPPTDQRSQRARQVIVLLATRALDISFGSTPLAGDLANAYLDIAEDAVTEKLVGHLPIEAMFRVADNFSAVTQRMFASARMQLLRTLWKPAIAPDANEKFADAAKVVTEQMNQEAEDHDPVRRIVRRGTAFLRDLLR